MACGEERIRIQEEIKPYCTNLIKNIRPIKLKNQIIHGDISGNILFSKNKLPVIIDLSLYYSPADFALAVMVIDALVWEEVSTKILSLYKNKKYFIQLLLRAELRRILEIWLCIEKLGSGNINNINKHKKLIDYLCKITRK